jgi:hypothetical protein
MPISHTHGAGPAVVAGDSAPHGAGAVLEIFQYKEMLNKLFVYFNRKVA